MVVSLAQTQLFFLALTRILAMILGVPMLGGNTIPLQIRVALGFLLALVMIPWQPLSAAVPPMPTLVMIMAILQEMIIGLIIGFAATLTFGAIQVAANFMGLNTGFAAGQVLNPTFGSSGSAYDSLYLIMCTLYFIALDGQLLWLKAMGLSFQILPLHGTLPPFSVDLFLRTFATMINIGFHLSLPVVAAVVLTDVSAGLLAKVAPQVQVFFLTINIKLVMSLIGVVIAFGITLPIMRTLFQHIGERGLLLIGVR